MTRSVYFGPKYEQESIDTGLAERQHEIGVNLHWWFFDAVNSTEDPTYPEGSFNETTGQVTALRWKGPHLIPVLSVTRTQGRRESQDVGFYTVDQLVMYLPYQQAVSAGLRPPPDQTADHLRDRFLFDNYIWVPTSIVSRNWLGGTSQRRAMIALSAEQVKADELQSSPDFAQWAHLVNNV